jgi:hypothetical protein
MTTQKAEESRKRGGGNVFDSKISAAELIEDLKNEVDIALPVSDRAYAMWLDSLEQLIYREIIQEQGKITIYNPADGVIDLSSLDISAGENIIRFEDIHTIYADETQLMKSTAASSEIFPNTFYKAGNGVGYNVFYQPSELKIIYFVRPALKLSPENGSISGNVMLPIEFIDLAKSKLRGEAYKVANEDNLAAKWLNDYNILLETFKAWIEDKSAKFGM